MKRRHIATSLRVVPHFVTNTILKVRKLGLDAASSLSGTHTTATALPRSVIQDNLAIVECMHACMEEQGIHKITLMSVYAYLKSHLPLEVQHPGMQRVQKLMKSRFHLKFRAASPAMVRFLDPTYNEKRLWVSRLLAQFILEDALIISIDESNFRSDSFSKRKWTFAPKVGTIS
jgi:hypothetical protein